MSLAMLTVCSSATAQTWVPTYIGALALGDLASDAEDLNDNGTVVGSTYQGGSRRGVVWSGGSGWTDLGTLGGTDTRAQGVNNASRVTGYSTLAGNSASHAFYWTGATGMLDIGPLGGTNSYGYRINDSGQIVGSSQTTGNAAEHAFQWTPGHGMLDLGTFGGTNSVAFAVNDVGQVVGSAMGRRRTVARVRLERHDRHARPGHARWNRKLLRPRHKQPGTSHWIVLRGWKFRFSRLPLDCRRPHD